MNLLQEKAPPVKAIPPDPIVRNRVSLVLEASASLETGTELLVSSADEVDSTHLLAHRYFFGLNQTQTTTEDQIQRVIVELAYFNSLDEGYYYCIMTPPKIQTNAAITDILSYPILNYK